MCYIGIYIVIELLLSTWGLTEVYIIPDILNINSTEFNFTDVNKTACDDLKYTPLWNFGLITVISQLTITGLLMLTTCYLCFKF